MRIRSKVGLVGGIPIAIGAAIAVVAWFLLAEAERARGGAVLAGGVYRDLLSVMRARDDYVGATPAARERFATAFSTVSDSARAQLGRLAQFAHDPGARATTEQVQAALTRLRAQMGSLSDITTRNDLLVTDMNDQAAALISLTDRARDRQHASNADIIASLATLDRSLRLARDVVDRAYDLRAAATDVETRRPQSHAMASSAGGAGQPEAEDRLGLARLRGAAEDLGRVLSDGGRARFSEELARLAGAFGTDRAPQAATDAGAGRLIDWTDRIIKLYATEHRALHEEVAQLLTYSVQSAETEQATQTIAISALKLAVRAANALAARDVEATAAIAAQCRGLKGTIAALPISPLIQTEMVDALDRWREGLATTGAGLRRQNDILAEMNDTAASMIGGATVLHDAFTRDADRIGSFVRTILALGAALGLLIGAGTAFVVARSITRPLARLRDGMMALAADPADALLPDSTRKDELGAMARAANHFVTEIGRREAALRAAKDQIEQTLADLRQAQTDLIQAEKHASLGQMVAGIAHEINTPVGIALTTSTTVGREAKRLNEVVSTGRVARSELIRIAERLSEGSGLLFSNLTRAADLIYSFKQVAVDQASGERRSFAVGQWAHELLTSLGPVLRPAGHTVATACPEHLVLHTYPGALAQVITNLVTNAVVHGYPDGSAGRITLEIAERGSETVQIVVADDGRGIAPELHTRVFDPFFTTGRDQGNTGLGLHIVYNLVTVTLQGRIAMESRPGRGTRFTVTIPKRVADPAPEPVRLSA
jgi:signal transduction histidine kinase